MSLFSDDDFLAFFKQRNQTRHNTKTEAKTNIFFKIEFDKVFPHNTKKAYVEVVDETGKPVDVDYRLYTGNIFYVLRSISNIKERRLMQISWREEDTHIYFAENPTLLPEMLTCDNIVDDNMRPIKVENELARLTLHISPSDSAETKKKKDNFNTDGHQLKASFYAETKSKKLKGQLLNDIYFLSDNTVYPIYPVGEDWQMADFFSTDFSQEQLEQFLSIFYSYFVNVELDYEDYQLEYSEQPQPIVPTLVIERVDSDLALNLRVAETVRNMDFDFIDKFDILYSVTLTAGHKVVLRRIMRSNNNDSVRELMKNITKWSPTAEDRRAVYNNDNFIIVPHETAGPFLIHELPQLVKDYQIVGVDKLRDYKVVPVKPKLNLRLGSGIDFLEGEASISIGKEEFSLKQFLQQYDKQKYILLSNKDKAIIDQEFIQLLQRVFRNVDKSGKVKVSFFDIPEVEELMQHKMDGEAFRHHREVYEGFNKLQSQKLDFSNVNATLRDYQKEGVKWINYLYENNLGGCLADDMGLGKTLQALAMLARIYPKEKKPTLIVMPRSLLFNWENEIRKFTPQLSFYTYYGQQRDLNEAKKAT